MLLLMLERDMPIDAVITADTGMEFPEMYEHLSRLDEHLFHERGIHMTVLRHPKGFEWLMFEEPFDQQDGQPAQGRIQRAALCRHRRR